MTEYDFSPEAYQRHLANMQRISRWVDHTEQYRSQSAFPTPDAVVDSRGGASSTRRIPPPLNLPAHDQRMPFYPPNPPHSVSSSQYFSYATSPGSPGPMPTPMHQHRFKSPTPSYGHGTMSPLSPLSYDSHPQSPGFSHGHGTPISPPPFNQYPVMPPGYVIVSSGRSNTRKKSSSSRRHSKSAPLIVSSTNSLRILVISCSS
jgi:hypothetical protein